MLRKYIIFLEDYLRPEFKNVYGIFIVAVVAILTTYFLFKNLSKKSDYSDTGYLKSEKIIDSVYIYTDLYGAKHIEANNESDMYFALGFVHAKDRLWQMDISRRIAEGKLSEILGNEAVSYDVLFRTVGISRISEKIIKELPQETIKILESYSEGINYFIDENSSKLPLEFDLLDYKPVSWKPINCIEILRLMGWQLNIAWYTDINFGKIIEKFGLDGAEYFFPDYPDYAPNIINSGKKPEEKKSDSTDSKITYNHDVSYKGFGDLAENFYNTAFEFRKYSGLYGTGTGSNAWTVNGDKSEKNYPLLANDPHLPLGVPSQWYEVGLINKTEDINAAGFSVPGIPGILIGRNKNISWGVTNLMNDEADFYILKVDPANPKHYLKNEDSVPLDSCVESISVKGTKDEIEIVVYSNEFGNVISHLPNGGINSRQGINVQKEHILTFKWTGNEYTNEVGALAGVMKSKNWTDFRTSLKSFGLPALNFVYADKENNIGYQAAGKIPNRKTISEQPLSKIAMYPTAGDVVWSGYIPYEEMPSVFNPKDSLIVTANNKPQSGYKHYISNLFEAHYRAERIEYLLKNRKSFNTKELGLIQNDVVSIQAKDFCEHLFKSYQDSVKFSSDEKTYLDSLKKWNFEFRKTSYEAVLFAFFEIELYKNLYKDKLGEELFINYLFLNNIAVRNTARLLKEGFPDKNKTLRKSFSEAVQLFKNKFGNTDLKSIQWGEMHKAFFNHFLDAAPAIGPVLRIGPFDMPGCGTTVNNLQFSFIKAYESKDFSSSLGPSARIIVDLSEDNYYLSVLPPGENGQLTNKDYSSQTRLWQIGDYKHFVFNIEALLRDNPQKFLLLPE